MKTLIVGIDQTTGIKVAEELFVNNNSAIENLVNYFLQGKGMQLFFIEQREKIKKDIVCINNRSALIERNGIDYIATRRDENNKPLPNSDEKTLLTDENSAKFYIENWLWSSWDVSNVSNMHAMFYYSAFNSDNCLFEQNEDDAANNMHENAVKEISKYIKK